MRSRYSRRHAGKGPVCTTIVVVGTLQKKGKLLLDTSASRSIGMCVCVLLAFKVRLSGLEHHSISALLLLLVLLLERRHVRRVLLLLLAVAALLRLRLLLEPSIVCRGRFSRTEEPGQNKNQRGQTTQIWVWIGTGGGPSFCKIIMLGSL